ncbi:MULTISPECIES: response regulator transcription factor [Nonlabens]|uniref:LuxR family two component transcriptional regulator n=1 Tax=Nonlabens xylanidelens TaxID=191564 RepID=A0A2S6IKJ6_9FLAO|nr:response regulator transcription factor [Nonlabens xylanidelens]PPK94754.1 LuxR family two component transcriptional regulator [Nonlabens xylanidelens]PQJ17321.1 DNA-binding response regulator [Nonlabens xylanidelens]
MINLALADDETLFLETLSFMLNRNAHFNVLFTATNGQEMIDQLNDCVVMPDVIITDLKMPVLNGIEATKKIHKDFPGLKVIALSSYDTDVFISNMLGVGAVSYLVKNSKPEEVYKTIKEVHEKGFYYNEKLLAILHENSQNQNFKKSALDKKLISDREKEVLELICKQHTTKEIADLLFISTRTVDRHRDSLLDKTDSRNVAGLVAFAIQNSLINLK